MSNVVPFARPEPEPVPNAEGDAFCFSCDHRWRAVAPVGVTEFECPSCRTMKGRWFYEFAPPPGTPVRHCNCGNRFFLITPDAHLCANCGTMQEY